MSQTEWHAKFPETVLERRPDCGSKGWIDYRPLGPCRIFLSQHIGFYAGYKGERGLLGTICCAKLSGTPGHSKGDGSIHA